MSKCPCCDGTGVVEEPRSVSIPTPFWSEPPLGPNTSIEWTTEAVLDLSASTTTTFTEPT